MKQNKKIQGLSLADQQLIMSTLPYMSESDTADGLNGVSPDDIYSYITDLIINTIDKVGHLPWQKDWIGSGADGTAKNYVSKKEYTGANFLLNFEVKLDKDGEPYLVPIKFKQPFYLTFNQIKEAKATLRAGAKARRVIYYTMIYNYENGALKIKTTDRSKFTQFVKDNNITKSDIMMNLQKIPVIKYYNVFRADDCTGLTFEIDKIESKKVNPIDEAQSIIDNYPNKPKYTFVGDRAYYMPAKDVVNMPNIKAFVSETSYYCTFFHEITHSTGAEKRLNRDFSGSFGTKAYAFEELIAELGAVFLCSEAGILFHTVENSAKYLASWNKRLVEQLEKDNKFFLKASAQSQKAVNHILDKEIISEEIEESTVQSIEVIQPKNSTKSDLKPVIKTRKRKTNSTQLELGLKGSKSNATVSAGKKINKSKSTVLPGIRNSKSKPTVLDKEKKVSEKHLYGPDKKTSAVKPKPTKVKKIILSNVQKQRYDKELASDNWKKYSKTISQPKKSATVLDVLLENKKPTQAKPKKTVQDLNKNSLAYKMANRPTNVEYFEIQDKEIAKLLGKIEKKNKDSVFISLTGSEGSMKTRMAFQIINAFAQKYKTGHASCEEHPDSTLYYDKADEYLNAQALKNIENPEIKSLQDLHKLILDNEVIVIDSFTKMKEIEKSFEVDKDCRKKYDGKLFIVIFQQTVDGKMRGGSKSQYDGDIVLFTEKFDDYHKNYVYATKHRYSKEIGLQYNIFSKSIQNNKAVTPANKEIKLKFKVK